MKSNFDFLNRYWPALAQIGANAETYVYSDPNACIYKLGMFAERLVQETAMSMRITICMHSLTVRQISSRTKRSTVWSWCTKPTVWH